MNSTVSVLKKLKQDFISELPEKIDGIEEHILACSEGDNYDEAFQEAYRKTHSLKGIGGTFGVPIITSICHQLEDVLNLWDKEALGMAGSHQSRCLDYIDLLRQSCEILQEGGEDFEHIREIQHQFQEEDFKNKLRVLLVDSSRTTREICKQTIQAYHAEVIEMTDGYEALGRLLNERFDVLIAGKEIGPLNGQMLISIVSELALNKRNLKTIMITSSSQQSSRKKPHSAPSLVVKKGVEMINELEAQFDALSSQKKP